MFARRSFRDAKAYRKIFSVLFSPSGRTMEQISDSHFLRNSPVACPSLGGAKKIFCPDLNAIKDNTVLLNTPEVRINVANIQISILGLYHNVTLVSDILYFNKISFLSSISASIKFITLECIIDRNSNTIEADFIWINTWYTLQGFTLSIPKMDNKFEPLRAGLSE